MQKFLILACNSFIINKKARLLLKAGNKSVTKRLKIKPFGGLSICKDNKTFKTLLCPPEILTVEVTGPLLLSLFKGRPALLL